MQFNVRRPMWILLAVVLFLGIPASLAAGSGFTQDAANLSPQQAIDRAVNTVLPTASGAALSNPQHEAIFDAYGVTFHPAHGGPDWQWRLVRIGRDDGVTESTPKPFVSRDESGIVRYDRGAVLEEWVPRTEAVEQRFVLLSPPSGTGDFIVDGAVTSSGSLEQSSEGWVWRSDSGVVSLGQVSVFDANGATLPARMEVDAGRTRIVVDGDALDSAAYPVVIDPEVGTNDFRISAMEMDGVATFDAINATVAYNSTNNEYLVVWHGDDSAGLLIDEEFEIYGQRINAATGAAVGNDDFRISDMGTDGSTAFLAFSPAVAYNPTDNEYLVVWEGDDSALNGFEIYGQRIFGDLLDGDAAGNNDFQISDMGPTNSNSEDATGADVVYNSTQNEYLVVWHGDDTDFSQVLNEQEVFVQRIEGDRMVGDEVGTNDLRISDLGGLGTVTFNAGSTRVAYNSTNDEYLVVWTGDDDVGGLIDDEFEVFGQRLDGTDASELGSNDFRISDVGGTGTATATAFSADVAYNSVNNEYLVVWDADDTDAGLSDNEFEVFGQRLAGFDGVAVSTNDFRISDMGGTNQANFDAGLPTVSYSPARNEYLVVWSGDDEIAPLVDGELEIFGQLIFGDRANGDETGTNDFRLSDMGTNGDTLPDAFLPAVDYNSTNDEYGIVWHGDDDNLGLADNEFEIFMQRFDPGNAPPALTFPGSALGYNENDVAMLIDMTATAPDPDSADLNGGSLTVSFTANGTANDQLAVQDSGVAGVGIEVSGSTVSFNGATIGSIDGTDTGVNGVDLTINFTTAAATPAALQALIRAITYANTSDNPSTSSRTVSFVATDGDGGTSFAATQTVNVAASNDSPALTLPSSALTYNESDPATPIDSAATVSDPDSADFNTGAITVSITVNGTSNDQLAVQDSGVAGVGIEVSGSTVSFNGSTIGMIDGTDDGVNGADLTINFTTASASPAAAQALAQAITYANSSMGPSTLARTVAFTVTDGDTGSSGAVTQTVNVILSNSDPSISLPSAAASFLEGGGAVIIEPAAIVMDADGLDFDTGTLTIDITVANSNDDRIGIRNQGNSAGQVGVSGSTVSFGGTAVGTFSGGAKAISALVVTFNASATEAAVQAVTRNITFDNVSLNPSSAPRTVQMTVTDGDGGMAAVDTQTVNVGALPLPISAWWLAAALAIAGLIMASRIRPAVSR